MEPLGSKLIQALSLHLKLHNTAPLTPPYPGKEELDIRHPSHSFDSEPMYYCISDQQFLALYQFIFLNTPTGVLVSFPPQV